MTQTAIGLEFVPCLAGVNAPALIEFVNALRTRLSQYSLLIYGDRGDADDVARATLMKMFASIDRLRDPNRPKSWVFRIAKSEGLMKRMKSVFTPRMEISFDERRAGGRSRLDLRSSTRLQGGDLMPLCPANGVCTAGMPTVYRHIGTGPEADSPYGNYNPPRFNEIRDRCKRPANCRRSDMGRNRKWIIVLLSLPLSATVWAASRVESARAGLSAEAASSSTLARYLASPPAPAWSAATIEIEASIPRLAKRGRLRAIRRSRGGTPPLGKPEYQVLEIDGDRTVRQQVIARYLSAEVEAAALPPASVEITPPNYRFRYKGSVADGGALAYIFEITPQKKRAGLIRGQLWIDAGTGLALRLTGYLVRRPSVFVRRVNVTRDTSAHDGVAYARITHVEIDTRLIGRAELYDYGAPVCARCW